LTGGDVGDLNDEAERRAKEKGLMGKNHHFQSMDTIGDTAISWTLGKMVIEASRGVDPHGHEPDHVGLNNEWTQIWRDGTTRVGSALGVPALENKLSTYGIELVWFSYLVLVVAVLSVYFSLRRRCWLTQGSITSSRRRKDSDVGAVRDWMRRRSSALPIPDGLPSSRSRSLGINRFKLLGYRVAGLASNWTSRSKRMQSNRRDTEPGMTLLSLPERDPSSYSRSSSLSLPPSPRERNESFFTPAQDFSQNATPMHKQFSSTLSGPPSPSASPSVRHGGLSHKSSMSALRSKRSHPKLPMMTSSSGWNDPPVSALGLSDVHDPNEEGVLLPNLAAKGSETKAISRNSSRINLSEYGRLAPRPASRGPGAGDV
jgi:Golgi apyrase